VSGILGHDKVLKGLSIYTAVYIWIHIVFMAKVN